MFVRVFMLPAFLPPKHRFGGGMPMPFVEVDWFRVDYAPLDQELHRANMVQFIKTKKYYDSAHAFLVLHPTHPIIINCDEKYLLGQGPAPDLAQEFNEPPGSVADPLAWMRHPIPGQAEQETHMFNFVTAHYPLEARESQRSIDLTDQERRSAWTIWGGVAIGDTFNPAGNSKTPDGDPIIPPGGRYFRAVERRTDDNGQTYLRAVPVDDPSSYVWFRERPFPPAPPGSVKA